MSRAELATLTLLSGAAGLSYEVLYARLISQYLGEVFYVQAAVLATMLLGIAVGARYSPRLRGRLWLVELGLGLYALAAATVHHLAFDTIVTHWVPAVGGAAVAITLTMMLLSPAAVLMGASLPLFAERSRRASAYPRAYGLYNIGAAVSVLLVEYVVVRALGLTSTLAVFGAMDILIAIRLRGSSEHAPPATTAHPTSSKTIGILCVAGVLASLYQLHALKQMQIFWGPFRETFALHVFGAIASIGVASLVLTRWRVGIATWLLGLGIAFPLALLLPSVVMPLYPAAVAEVSGAPRQLIAAGFFAVLYLPPLLAIGGVLPSLYNRDPQSGPMPLAANALGNAIGFAAYPLLVHPWLDDRWLLVSVAAGWVVLATVVSRQMFAVAGLASVVLLATTFDARIHTICFRDLYSPRALAAALDGTEHLEVDRIASDTIVYRHKTNGTQSATVNGHRTIWVNARGGNLAELLHGVVPLAYVGKRQRALSIGMGTGITTGALAEAFEQVTAVEISPAIIEALPRFAAFNFDVADRPDVQITLADGMVFLYQTDQRFDLISLTIDGPFYQSSSKMYSRELLEKLRERLTPDGVVTLWLEQSYSKAVTHTIVATVVSVFEHCHIAALNLGYMQMVCGVAPLNFVPLTDDALSPAVRQALARRVDVEGFVRRAPALYFDRVATLSEPPAVPLNTLDRPVLEFARTTHTRSHEPLSTLLGLNFTSQPTGIDSMALTPAQHWARCDALQWMFGAAGSCRSTEDTPPR